MRKSLPKSRFIKEDVDAQAMENPSALIQYARSMSPGQWYVTLKLDKKESKYNLPKGILQHLIDIESKGNLDAKSSKGAKSLFGIMPSGKSGFMGNINDPVETAEFAAKTLHDLIRYFGNSIEEGLAAYNCGMGTLSKRGIQNVPLQTKKYLKFFREKGIIPQNGVDVGSWGEDQAEGSWGENSWIKH